MAFIGLRPSEDCRAAIDRRLTGIRQHLSGVEWVRPHDYHITLKFFRFQDSLALQDIQTLMAEIAGRYRDFKVQLGELRMFMGQQGTPRVLWLDIIEGRDWIAALMQELNQALAKLGVKSNQNEDIAHLTVGRVLQHKVFDRKYLELYPLKEDLVFRAETLVLMKRRRHALGQIDVGLYEILRQYEFKNRHAMN